MTATANASRWISREYADLVDSLCNAGPRRMIDFDVVIVGSGYGGAIAAAVLAGSTLKKDGRTPRIAVLERGREYLPGSFPARMDGPAAYICSNIMSTCPPIRSVVASEPPR